MVARAPRIGAGKLLTGARLRVSGSRDGRRTVAFNSGTGQTTVNKWVLFHYMIPVNDMVDRPPL